MKRFFYKIYDYYLFHLKLRSKFMLSHLLIAIVPTIFITVFSYSQLLTITTNNTLKSLAAISTQTQTALGNTISQIETVASSIESQDFFISYIYSDSPADYTRSPSFLTSLNDFYTMVSSLTNSSKASTVKIYVDNAHYNALQAYSEEGLFEQKGLFEPLAKTYGTYWHGILTLNPDQPTLVCPSKYLSPYEISNYGDLAIIHNIKVNDYYVHLVVYFDQRIIDSILKQDLPFTESVIYILNEREELVSTTSTRLSGTYLLKYSRVPSLINTTTKFVTVKFANSSVYCNYKTIPGTDWYMITTIPASSMSEQGDALLYKFLFFYLAILILGIILALNLNHSIIKRISSVISQMQGVRFGIPTHLDTKGGTDEVGELIETYNYMSDQLDQLMLQKEQSARELRLSEFKALQAQINPHFLYNTLDMINWMARTGKATEVSLAVQRLSKFYRLTLSKGNNIVSIRDELEHVSLYVQLQNMRYENKIHFFIDVPDDLLDFEIPKLVFQPIVENAIFHGILGKASKEGNIVIMGWLEDDIMVFTISDDGVGIPSEALQTILLGNSTKETGNNIAIYNTHKRLQVFFGEEYGLSYRSTLGVETEVQVRIPAKPLQEDME
ncbi:MAG TPA: sensor histidine kinase [Clostridiales bacterium]|nr:sensor histidine kinase [Clostridiales bacterium]